MSKIHSLLPNKQQMTVYFNTYNNVNTKLNENIYMLNQSNNIIKFKNTNNEDANKNNNSLIKHFKRVSLGYNCINLQELLISDNNFSKNESVKQNDLKVKNLYQSCATDANYREDNKTTNSISKRSNISQKLFKKLHFNITSSFEHLKISKPLNDDKPKKKIDFEALAKENFFNNQKQLVDQELKKYKENHF